MLELGVSTENKAGCSVGLGPFCSMPERTSATRTIFDTSMTAFANEKPPALRRVILFNKITRWEVLCQEAQGDPDTLSDMENQFPGMIETHRTHTAAVNHILHELRDVHQISVDVVKAQLSSYVDLEGVDAILSAGGDGTFLEAASLVNYTSSSPSVGSPQPKSSGIAPTELGAGKPCVVDHACPSSAVDPSHLSSERCEAPGVDPSQPPALPPQHRIWVFGLNTDPSRSEGHLLMTSGGVPPITVDVSPSVYERCSQITCSPDTLATNNSSPRCPLRRTLTCRLSDPAAHHRQLSTIIERLVAGRYTPIRRQRLRISIMEPVHPRGRIIRERPPGVTVRSNSISLAKFGSSRTRVSEGEAGSADVSPLGSSFSVWPATQPTGGGRSLSGSPRGRQLTNFPQLPTGSPSHRASSQAGSLRPPTMVYNNDKDSLGPQFNASQNANGVAYDGRHDSQATNDGLPVCQVLEYRAVNDILLTRLESHLTMYVEVSVDGGPPQRSKNSGVLVCTGSGSSAWALNVSKVSQSTVSCIVDAVLEAMPPSVRETFVPPSTSSLCARTNARLIFDPTEPRMRYVVREPIDNRIFATPYPSGFCKRITLKPLTLNACLSLDGLKVLPVKYGHSVCIEIGHEEDALLTAV